MAGEWEKVEKWLLLLLLLPRGADGVAAMGAEKGVLLRGSAGLLNELDVDRYEATGEGPKH